MSQETRAQSRRRYLVGYLWALVLTLTAFGAVCLDGMSRSWTLVLVAVAGILQVGVHLRYFLHLGFGTSRREDLLLVLFAILIMSLMVGGSAWIMSDLHQRMM